MLSNYPNHFQPVATTTLTESKWHSVQPDGLGLESFTSKPLLRYAAHLETLDETPIQPILQIGLRITQKNPCTML